MKESVEVTFEAYQNGGRILTGKSFDHLIERASEPQWGFGIYLLHQQAEIFKRTVTVEAVGSMHGTLAGVSLEEKI